MKSTEFKRRRHQLMKMIGKGSIAIISSSSEKQRNSDVNFPFRQDSDFLYLTGFNEPEAVLVLIPGREHGETILFCREKDPKTETWHGRMAGQEGAINDFGADDSFPVDDINDILPGLLEPCNKVYHIMGRYPEFDQRLIGWVNNLKRGARSGANVPNEFVALDHLLHDMRLFKSSQEIKFMRQSAKISVEAHIRAMKNTQPGKFEFEIEAEFSHQFRRYGADHAYPPIVGGGANGCILHYTENNAKLKNNQLLLIDSGCEVNGYAADITRTFPINGKYTKAQRELYNIVLKAQKAAFAKIKPGNHWNDPHDAAVYEITKGLIELKLLKGKIETLIDKKAYQTFYMHKTGHWLGLDVHDVGDYKVGDLWRLLEPGMVLTVEPGLYIPAGNKDVPKKYWDIGIRIEDDVLVTKDGCDILTEALVTDPDAIEQLMAS